MKGFKNCLAVVVVVMAAALSTVSCKSVDVKSNAVGEYNLIPKIAGKDFVVLGLVSVNAEVSTKVSPLYLSKTLQGEQVTFDLLLQKAKELYPEVSDIINVRIDKVEQLKTRAFWLRWLTGYQKTDKYVGNALAVKYTDALQEVQEPLEGKANGLPKQVEKSILDSIKSLFD
jgi:hypothetical protein